MTKNRLDLDFSLSDNEKRTEFVNSYVRRPEFQSNPLTNSELEMIANYILWGRNTDSGLNSVQDKSVQIATKNGNWDNAHKTESLDALLEQPLFNETQLAQTNTHYTKKVTKFSRAAALNGCSPEMALIFKDLFGRIDALDLEINFYELEHGKRSEIRQALLNKFSEDELTKHKLEARTWSAYKYLKMRHYLVELRREQYALNDSITQPIVMHSAPQTAMIAPKLDWGAEIQVKPLGLMSKDDGCVGLVFRDKDTMNPNQYSEADLEKLNKWFWAYREPGKFTFDFRKLEDVYTLMMAWESMEDSAAIENVEGGIGDLIKTLRFYMDFAELSEMHTEILDMKIKKVRNQDIANFVNKKYGKNYTINYISTIFRQKIIPQINAAAEEHGQRIELMYFDEEFKTCSCCGRTYLRTKDNFVKNKRAKDGLSSKCKACDKQGREEKKVIKNGK